MKLLFEKLCLLSALDQDADALGSVILVD